ncbi:GntR family transcriptional regulator [Arthrobacter sp. NPDC058192]|uniref:GntR family transcriptional regulator n=1 Tax=Arthrobacter sp. NPDC058192 TaxID=3346372 RepID=UPI0036E3EA49
MAASGELLVLQGRPTAELIADQLRERIVQGKFRPGQQINESVLATQLNTSRGPLREALQRLCQEGILVSVRNRGVFVLELSEEDIQEIYDVREAVEMACAHMLLNAGPEKVKKTAQTLKGIIANMAKNVAAANWQALAKLDMDFHTAFVAGTGNSRMIRIYETLAAESRMCILDLEVAYPRVDVLVTEHQKLLDLLEAGDELALQQAIRTHMQGAVEDLNASKEAQVLA